MGMKLEINLGMNQVMIHENRQKGANQGKKQQQGQQGRVKKQGIQQKQGQIKAQGGNQTKSKKKVTLDDILKYINSEDRTVQKVKEIYEYSEGSNKIKTNIFQYSIQNGKITLVKAANGRAGQIQINEDPPHSIFATSEGILWYNPFKMYNCSQKLYIQYNLSLEKISPVAIIPHVNDATKFRFQGEMIIFFIPYRNQGDKEYFEYIRIFSWNKTKKQFEFCFEYKRADFHITCASCTKNYLVLSFSRPYSESESKFETNQRELVLLKEIKQLHQARLYNCDFSNVQKLRLEELNDELLRHQQNVLNQARNNRDPVDFFVWDSSTFKLVLEYHKPADHVHVLGSKLYLENQGTHQFNITLKTEQLKQFEGFPLYPEKLCPNF